MNMWYPPPKKITCIISREISAISAHVWLDLSRGTLVTIARVLLKILKYRSNGNQVVWCQNNGCHILLVPVIEWNHYLNYVMVV